MIEVAIAVPGSLSISGANEYFALGGRYKQNNESELKFVHNQKKTLGVALEATGIPESNQFIIHYPQSLNVLKNLVNGANLKKSASIDPNDFYGRSVDIGVRTLAQAVESIAVSSNFVPVRLTLIGYSQGSEIAQIFMASASSILESNVYRWFETSLMVSILIANPLRYFEDGTNHLTLNTDGDRILEPVPDGSLVRHKHFINTQLNPRIAANTYNIYRQDDVIAAYPEMHGVIKRLGRTLQSASKYHTDYTIAKKLFRQIFHSFGFGKSDQVLSIKEITIPQCNLDSNETYYLAKQYILARTGTSTYIRYAFMLESRGIKNNWLRQRMMLVDDNYGALGKTVQTAVWARVAQICAYKLDQSAYLHKSETEVRSFKHLGIVSPYEYIQLVFRMNEMSGGGTEFLAQKKLLHTVIDRKPNAQMVDIVLNNWKMIPDHGIPNWIFGRNGTGQLTDGGFNGWDGNPNTPGVKEFLREAVESTKVGGSNLSKDLMKVRELLRR